MRRADREVKDQNQLICILEECKVLRIAMQDEEGLYIVPLNFGYVYQGDKLFLYLHSAKEGRKINAIKKTGKVAFEMDCRHELVEGDTACMYGFNYQSIIGNGCASIIDNIEEKKSALAILMKHQTAKNFEFSDAMANSVTVIKVEVESFTGKSCSR